MKGVNLASEGVKYGANAVKDTASFVGKQTYSAVSGIAASGIADGAKRVLLGRNSNNTENDGNED